jgi:hypothetical protein
MIPDPLFKHVDEICVISGKDDQALYRREMYARKWHDTWQELAIKNHVDARIEWINRKNKTPLYMLGSRFWKDKNGSAETCSAALGDFIATNWYRDPYITTNMADAPRQSLSTGTIEKVMESRFVIPANRHYVSVSTFLARDAATNEIIDNDRDMDIRKQGTDYIVMMSNFVSNFDKDDVDAISVLEQYYPIDDSIEISAISRSIPVPAVDAMIAKKYRNLEMEGNGHDAEIGFNLFVSLRSSIDGVFPALESRNPGVIKKAFDKISSGWSQRIWIGDALHHHNSAVREHARSLIHPTDKGFYTCNGLAGIIKEIKKTPEEKRRFNDIDDIILDKAKKVIRYRKRMNKCEPSFEEVEQ